MSLFEDASLITTPNAYKAGKLYSIKPTNGDGDLDVVRATTATRVNSAGLIETVANNVPRLDYTNGSCPSVLVEPQRTNLILRSEEFENVYWTKQNVTIETNSILSPNGIDFASKVVNATGATNPRFFKTGIPSTSGTLYTISGYFKANGNNIIARLQDGATANIVDFNLSTKASQIISGAPTNIFIKEISNGWIRCGFSFIASINVGPFIYLTPLGTIGDGTGGYIWGAQLEAGSNATSYIPTVASAVTRNGDVIGKTGISDLIGQTEGTLFADVNIDNSVTGSIATIDDGSSSNFISVIKNANRSVRVSIRSAGGAFPTIITTSILSIGRHKIALNYKNGDYAVYVDGVLEGTSTNSTNYPVGTLLRFSLSDPSYGFFNDSYNSVLLFKTRLSNAQLEALTTI